MCVQRKAKPWNGSISNRETVGQDGGNWSRKVEVVNKQLWWLVSLSISWSKGARHGPCIVHFPSNKITGMMIQVWVTGKNSHPSTCPVMTYVLLVLAGRSRSPQSVRRPSHHRGNMLVHLIWQGAEGTSDTVSRDGQVAKCEYSVQ
jgi:hypothetical protein